MKASGAFTGAFTVAFIWYKLPSTPTYSLIFKVNFLHPYNQLRDLTNKSPINRRTDRLTDRPRTESRIHYFGRRDRKKPRKSSILFSSFSSRAHVSIQGGPPPSFLHVKGRDWERIEREERRKNVMEMEKSTETISRFHTRERMYAPSDIRARNSRAERAV